MKLVFKTLMVLFFYLLLTIEITVAQTPKSDSLKQLLCKKWHLVKMTDITGGGTSMGGDLFNIDTQFNRDGTILTSTSGKITYDNWKLDANTMSLETNQLKDPASGQERTEIVELTEKQLKVNITYRGNNIMRYEYQSY